MKTFALLSKTMMSEMGEKFNLRQWARTASSGCGATSESEALQLVLDNQLTALSDLLTEREAEQGPAIWLNRGTGVGETPLLETAITTPDRSHFVPILVEAGARADLVGGASGMSPLHLAAEAGDPKLLEVLLTDAGADINVRAADRKGGWGPLHFAAQGEGAGHLACLELLAQMDEVEVDVRDIRAVQTPLAVAALAGNEAAVRLLLRYGADPDLKCGRKTVREYLTDTLPHLNPSSVTVVRRKQVMQDLEARLIELVRETKRDAHSYQSDLGAFRSLVRCVKEGGEGRELGEVLALAAEKGLEEHVGLLLRRGAGPNSAEQPLLEAAARGHHRVVAALVADPRTDLGIVRAHTEETVLHQVLKMEERGVAVADYRSCLSILLRGESRQAMAKIVNKRDSLGNTALHYATQRWPEEAVTELLELGANIGVKNHPALGAELPISRIKPETMEAFLDNCIVAERDVMHEDFGLEFSYSFLAPDKEVLPEQLRRSQTWSGSRRRLEKVYDEEEEEVSKGGERSEERSALPETESLWYMGQSKEHRHLLRHPVITSFLWFKWQRIRKIFNRNLRLFLLFVALLTWYVFAQFGGKTQEAATAKICFAVYCLLSAGILLHIGRDFVRDVTTTRLPSLLVSSIPDILLAAFIVIILVFGSSLKDPKDILRPAIVCLLCILASVEVLQLSVSLKRYILSVENWIEVSMIVIVAVLLKNEGGNFELNRSLAAISIMFSWAKVITLIGRHPKNIRLNIYVTMFFKVLTSFFYFLIWYGLFIVAFGISFYIMLHTDFEGHVKPDGEEEYAFFNTTFLSVVKTLTMFVGELEFSDIPINLESSLYPLNYLFFLSFVFLIVVVLMNLLNGLAVSDTGRIQEQAEIYSHLSRVETISYLESVILGDPFDFLSNVPRLLSWLPACSLLRQVGLNLNSNVIKIPVPTLTCRRIEAVICPSCCFTSGRATSFSSTPSLGWYLLDLLFST